MPYRKDLTGVAQTSANTAATLTAALVEGGIITSVEQADEYFKTRFAATFDELAPVVREDNEVFAAAEAAEAASGKRSRSAGKKPAAAPVSGDPGDLEFFGGKFKGCTIAQVYAMDEPTAKETYGHQFGDGASYIVKYVATDKNTNETTRQAAQAFLATVSEEASA